MLVLSSLFSEKLVSYQHVSQSPGKVLSVWGLLAFVPGGYLLALGTGCIWTEFVGLGVPLWR